MTEKNYYELLEVDSKATLEEIRKSFRKKSKELHPDRNPDSLDAQSAYAEVTAAYAVLSDPKKREEYDTGNFNVWDDWDDLPDAPKGEAPPEDFTPPAPVAGADIFTEIVIAYRTAMLGATKVINVLVDGNQTNISVTIPKGSKTGTVITLEGEGGYGKFGGPRGRIFVHLVVEDEPLAEDGITRTSRIRPAKIVPSETPVDVATEKTRSFSNVFKRNIALVICALGIISYGVVETSVGDSVTRVFFNQELSPDEYASYCFKASQLIEQTNTKINDTNAELDKSERNALSSSVTYRYNIDFKTALDNLTLEMLSAFDSNQTMSFARTELMATCLLTAQASLTTDAAGKLDSRISEIKNPGSDWIPDGFTQVIQDANFAWNWSDKYDYCVTDVKSHCYQIEVISHLLCESGVDVVYSISTPDIGQQPVNISDTYSKPLEADKVVFIESDISDAPRNAESVYVDIHCRDE